MTVEEKYKPLATMAPAINLVFASNFPIRMAEEDTALLSRMVVIPFRFSIPTEQQDHLLTQKILAERDGIFLRAIHAYHRLLADKYIFCRTGPRRSTVIPVLCIAYVRKPEYRCISK